MKSNKLFITGIIAVGLVTTSCQKKTTETYANAVEEDNYAAAVFDEISSIADEAAQSDTLQAYKNTELEGITSTCAIVTRDTSNDVITFTVDFGESNCTCQDGRERRGKIITSFTGKYREAGTVITHTLEGYYVDDNEVTGTRKVTNDGNYKFSVEANGSIVFADGRGILTWASNRTRTWSEGYDTWVWNDDVYLVTGTASGTTAAGNAFTVNITGPLKRIIKIGCVRHFVAGILEIEVDGKKTRILDYGNGSCDDQATLTVGNRSKEITLR